jgi:hypothetical protein
MYEEVKEEEEKGYSIALPGCGCFLTFLAVVGLLYLLGILT